MVGEIEFIDLHRDPYTNKCKVGPKPRFFFCVVRFWDGRKIGGVGGIVADFFGRLERFSITELVRFLYEFAMSFLWSLCVFFEGWFCMNLLHLSVFWLHVCSVWRLFCGVYCYPPWNSHFRRKLMVAMLVSGRVFFAKRPDSPAQPAMQGFAFVQFKNASEAREAMTAMNGFQLAGPWSVVMMIPFLTRIGWKHQGWPGGVVCLKMLKVWMSGLVLSFEGVFLEMFGNWRRGDMGRPCLIHVFFCWDKGRCFLWSFWGRPFLGCLLHLIGGAHQSEVPQNPWSSKNQWWKWNKSPSCWVYPPGN